jgi:hypothetical protein
VATVHGYTRAFEVSTAMIVVAFVLTAALLRGSQRGAEAQPLPEPAVQMASEAA